MSILHNDDPLPAVDPEQLLATGAMAGPYRRTHPITLSLWARIRRAVRAYLTNRRSPL